MLGTHLMRLLYKHGAKPLLFRQDPEDIHERVCRVGEFLGHTPLARVPMRYFFSYEDTALEQTLCGVHFSNPVGLAAGFDKNARLTPIRASVGFGFAEVGSITGEPCLGNPRPRLWRLPQSEALLVYYGLKNDGCESVAAYLEQQPPSLPIGISAAKTNHPTCTGIQAGIDDYVKTIRRFSSIGDYFTLNISCPNAFGGEPFTDPERLHLLLSEVDKVPTHKPFFLKIPADLSFRALDALVTVADQHRIHGMIISNLTKQRGLPGLNQNELPELDKGGISGKPVAALSNALISHLYQTTHDRDIIVGCGGIFSASDAYEKSRCGASLVQLITGLIFEGPQLVGQINQELVQLLHKDGFTHIREAVGAAHRA